MNVRPAFRRALTALALMLAACASAFARDNARYELRIPDIPGYVTLKCDFHTHTVFSDGKVWPEIRVQEAWRDGLDAIAISDHIEYNPHQDDVRREHNRSYEVAKPIADQLGILLVRAAEITKQVPPGHFNALFLEDVTRVEHEDYLESVGRAIDQGAFVFWNHPPFRQVDEQSIWHPQHTELYERGWLHGIEVVNGKDYYPEAQTWCAEKGLTMLGTSDVHTLIDFDYDPHAVPGDYRPMTLVFAEEKSLEAVKQALFARRTAVFAAGNVYGESQYLRPLFEAAVDVVGPRPEITGKGRATVQVINRSDIAFELAADGELAEVDFPDELRLVPGATVTMQLTGRRADLDGDRLLRLPYRVKNLAPSTGESLGVQLPVEVTFRKPEKK